jgi:hypothetical protein
MGVLSPCAVAMAERSSNADRPKPLDPSCFFTMALMSMASGSVAEASGSSREEAMAQST